MIIKSIDKSILFESPAKTIKRTVEEAVSRNISLAKADLRKASLRNAELDGIRAPGACFWGADFTGADMAMADLTNADLRNSCFENTCLAHSLLCNADMRGAFFSKTLLEGADLSGIFFSCPSLYDCDLRFAKSLNGARFLYKGEDNIPIDHYPVVIKGLPETMVMMDERWIYGRTLLQEDGMKEENKLTLSILRTALNLVSSEMFWQNAKPT